MPQATALKPIVPSYTAAGAKEIWLTFDDGPHPTHTKKVVATLAAHQISAIFFVVGRNCVLYPQTLKMVVDAGHRIANHTYTHPNLTTLTKAKIREELLKTERIISPFMHGRKLFRPPYGAHNAAVDDVAADMGYRLVLWSVDTIDWSRNFKPDKWVQHGVNQIKARQNSVVLMHDIHSTTAANLDLFIRKIKAISGAKFKPAATL